MNQTPVAWVIDGIVVYASSLMEAYLAYRQHVLAELA